MEEPGEGQRPLIRVLLVEDNPADARLLEESLKDVAPATFSFARHGRLDAALAYLKDGPSDIALLDLGLPDTNGLATLQRFNQSAASLPVVILTGLDDEELALQALSLGAQDYVIKGRFDPALLARTLRYALARHRRAQDLDAAQLVSSSRRYAGLPTREVFNQWQRQAVVEADRSEAPFTLFLISIERFRTITDVFGSSVGELLVCEAARRVAERAGAGAMLASLGGNDLGLIWPGHGDHDRAGALAEDLIAGLCRPYMVDQGELFIACSIGIDLYKPGGREPYELLRRADLALQKAKLAGGNSYQFYHADMQQEAARQLALDSGLRMALKRGEFVLYYQPCVELQTRRVVGLEALVRWRHPERGLISPDEFIPAAEQSGLIREIDQWVLKKACVDARGMLDQVAHPVSIAVNLSAADFVHDALPGEVESALRAAGLPAAALEIELTESALMKSPDQALRALKELKRLGVSLSVDDFGVGYSSLSYLRQLPVDILKVDRSFIRDLGEGGSRGAALVESVIALCKSLSLSITAEGVETWAQFEWLLAQGCDRGQGYLFSRPVPQPDIVEMERLFATLPYPGTT